MAAKQQEVAPATPTKAVRAKFTDEDWRQYVNIGLKQSQAAILDAGLRVWQFRQECEGINTDQDFFLKAKELWGFSDTASSMWSKIGSNFTRLNGVVDSLPPSYRSIYHLTMLDEDRFKQAVDNQEIKPDLTQVQAKALAKPAPKKEETKKKKEEKKKADAKETAEANKLDAEQKAKRDTQNDPLPSDDIIKHVGLSITGDSDALGVLGIDSYFPRVETLEVVIRHYRTSRKDSKELVALIDAAEEHLKTTVMKS